MISSAARTAQVAAADVGLSLEDADRRQARELLAHPLQGEVHDRAVEEDDAGRDDGGKERPALGAGSCARQCRTGTDMLRSMPGPGPIALVGSGEFLPAMAEIDAALLAASGRSRPRVAILPTASWPDGEEVFRRWADMGAAHFTALGAEVEPVLVRDRFDGRRRCARPGDRRGGPRLPVGRQARPPDREPPRDARRRRDRRGSRARGGAGRLLGRGDDPCRPPFRFPDPADARSRSAGRTAWRSCRRRTVIPHYDAWPEAAVGGLRRSSRRGTS